MCHHELSVSQNVMVITYFKRTRHCGLIANGHSQALLRSSLYMKCCFAHFALCAAKKATFTLCIWTTKNMVAKKHITVLWISVTHNNLCFTVSQISLFLVVFLRWFGDRWIWNWPHTYLWWTNWETTHWSLCSCTLDKCNRCGARHWLGELLFIQASVYIMHLSNSTAVSMWCDHTVYQCTVPPICYNLMPHVCGRISVAFQCHREDQQWYTVYCVVFFYSWCQWLRTLLSVSGNYLVVKVQL